MMKGHPYINPLSFETGTGRYSSKEQNQSNTAKSLAYETLKARIESAVREMNLCAAALDKLGYRTKYDINNTITGLDHGYPRMSVIISKDERIE